MAEKETEGEQDQSQQALIRERVGALIGKLEQEALDRVSKRDIIEKRWLKDLQQFHGEYEDGIKQDLSQANKSQLFINQTRPKTNAMERRLSDMLFPTDDRNWGIEPTPVPELTVEAEDAARKAQEAHEQADEAPQDSPQAQQAQMRAKAADDVLARLRAEMDEARKRSASMQEEIDDHLRQCDYGGQARLAIRDACRIGTGVIKGPVVGDRNRRKWARQEPEQADENGQPMPMGMMQGQDQGPAPFELQSPKDTRPAFWRVDPWGFFPDMDARSMDDCESVYERHLMNPRQLRRMARQPGFDADAIRALLKSEPRHSTPTFIADLRSINGDYNDTATNRYHVWEYHGPITGQDLRDLAVASGREDMAEDLEEDDPLEEIQAVVWFCDGQMLKFGIHPLDSGEPVYSVFNLEQSEASMFGFGVPYMMRHSQSSINAGWRTMMDNAGLSSGPQIVVNEDVVEPANGSWELESRKVWRRRNGSTPGQPAFETYDIPMHQAELANIVEMSKRNSDEETGMPMVAQGEQGAQTTKTAQGMTLLMNSANIVFRGIVKNWDDQVTIPNIRRIYDWLMQFSDKDHIKGDYQVDARGTSVLLVREMQSQNLMSFLQVFSGHPTLGGFLKKQGLPAMRRLAQTMMIPADEIVMTDKEVAEEAAKAADQPPQPDPQILKIEAEMNRAEMDRETKLELAQFERETAMMTLAAKHNMTLDELRTRLQIKQMDTDSRERTFAAETAVEQRFARMGVAQGSGGYISAPAPRNSNGGGQ
ncbi:MAG: hypothetical protein RJQ08_13715 [Salinisphaeraceae bacterium]